MPGVYEKGEKQLRVIKLFARLCETEVGLTTRQLAAELPEAQAAEALTLIDKLEQEEDVQRVFHTLV